MRQLTRILALVVGLSLGGCVVGEFDYDSCLYYAAPSPVCGEYFTWVPGWWTLRGEWVPGYYARRPEFYRDWGGHYHRRAERDHRWRR